MAGVSNYQTKYKVFSYKRHAFYADHRKPNAPWEHFDAKGKKVFSECYDETEAMDYVNNDYHQR